MSTGPTTKILLGSCLEKLKEIPDGSVQSCVTSPPYWGLRDYGTAKWEGGDPGCEHVAVDTERTPWANAVCGPSGKTGKNASSRNETKERGGYCSKCGARRVDAQLGMEQTPEDYVANMVLVFQEVWRVLRDDGTLWLNLGDSYNVRAQGRSEEWVERTGGNMGINARNARTHEYQPGVSGLKPKDLVGIPWRVAFALQSAGWYLRSDIIWAKPNCMPEPVTDRPTKSHEYVFLLTKSERYFYDVDAISETAKGNMERPQQRRARELAAQHGLSEDHIRAIRSCGVSDSGKAQVTQDGFGKNSQEVQAMADEAKAVLGGYYREFLMSETRNRRSVWTVTTKPYRGAHFATMPTALVEPCILAGTSEKGCCPSCGSPWARIVSRTEGRVDRPNHQYDPNRPDGMTLRGGRLVPGSSSTVGWQPTCKCSVQDPIPCTVLDPFTGSGTTLAVAVKLGRSGVGCELNPDYIKLAEERILRARGGVPDPWDVEPVEDEAPESLGSIEDLFGLL